MSHRDFGIKDIATGRRDPPVEFLESQRGAKIIGPLQGPVSRREPFFQPICRHAEVGGTETVTRVLPLERDVRTCAEQ